MAQPQPSGPQSGQTASAVSLRWWQPMDAPPGLMMLANWAAALTLGAGLLDALSTQYGVELGATEANPVVAWLMFTLGPWWIYPKLLGHVLIAAVILWRPSMFSLSVLSLIMLATSAVAASNYHIGSGLLPGLLNFAFGNP